MLQEILDHYTDDDDDNEFNTMLMADGFEDACIGIADDFMKPRLIYSVTKCLEILEKNMTPTEALEYFTFNVSGGYVGEQTPIWCWDDFE